MGAAAAAWSILFRPANRPYLLGGVLVGLAMGTVLTVASALAAGWGTTRAPQVVAVTIPAGTAAEIAAGERSSPIPSTLRLVAGDTLLLHNGDVVSHRVGAYVIAPGATVAIPVVGGGGGTFFCSFHPSRSISLDVATPPDLRLLPLAALGFGLPIGGVLGALAALFRAWGDEGEGAVDPRRREASPHVGRRARVDGLLAGSPPAARGR
jgi:hypothetical protein